MASTSILQAAVSFTFRGPKGPVAVRKGSTYHRDSPRLEGVSTEALEANFVPFSPDFGLDSDSDVEQATAAPGEKRRGPKRSKESAEKTQEKQATAAPGENADAGQSGESGSADAETVKPDPSQDGTSSKVDDSGDKS